MTGSQRPIRIGLAVVGALLVFGAFGVFAFAGIGDAATDICLNHSTEYSIYSATRVWLPIVGAACTQVVDYDMHIQRIVFDWPASAVAVVGWALLALSVVRWRRR